jgi:hypothetical protein
MRISLMAAGAVLILLSGSAFAAQDTPTTQNGIETVCTGVGSAKDDPRWSGYPVKIVLATQSGANLANAHITLAKGGKPLVQTECDAPWILFKVPAGSYTATATLVGGTGQSHSANFTTSGGGARKQITIMFARPSAAN